MAIIVGIAISLVVSLVASAVVQEFYVWLPALSGKLLNRAVDRLPSSLQERYREEWQAHLDGTPNSLWRLVAALGLGFSARGLCLDTLRTAEGEMQDLIESSGPKLRKLRAAFVVLREKREENSLRWQKVRPHIAAFAGSAPSGETGGESLKPDASGAKKAEWRRFLAAADVFLESAQEEFNSTKQKVEVFSAAIATATEKYRHLPEELSRAERADSVRRILDEVNVTARTVMGSADSTRKITGLLRELKDCLPK